MASNETVHFVAEEMKEPVFHYGGVDSVVSLRLCDFAARFEAAHNREIAAKDAEIAELRECLKEACAAVCSGGLVGCKGTFAYDSKCCLLAECEYHKWRKALEGAKDEGK